MKRGCYGIRGRFYEVLFSAECLKRGLIVLTPECTHHGFDVVVMSGDKFFRVQVKGTESIQRRKQSDGYGFEQFYSVNCFGAGEGRKHYRDRGVDVIAAYVEPWDEWYIIPMALATGRRFEMRPDSTGKAGTCRANWSHFTGETKDRQNLNL